MGQSRKLNFIIYAKKNTYPYNICIAIDAEMKCCRGNDIARMLFVFEHMNPGKGEYSRGIVTTVGLEFSNFCIETQ